MPTPQAITATYSFISALMADPVLTPFGSNALPLFAVALHLGVDDLASFATESLTDHPADKKADIIYINEADGIACVGQGFMAVEWGKQAAPSNKASDLNTAAAWLLQRPIEEVPDAIRAHAKLLRDGLDKKTINKVIFAYAHNALESHNVDVELATVSHLLEALDIMKGVDIEVVELGLRRTEALYLTSQGAIQVTDEIEIPAKERLFEQGPNWHAYVVSLNGAELGQLYETHKNALFSANLRDFLGARKVSGNVNNQIKKTAEENPGDFFVLNNGVTLVTKKAEILANNETLKVYGVSVVNGAQTTGGIHAVGAQHAKGVKVLARIIVVDDERLIPVIVGGNNTQNSIVAWDRRSNDPIQVRIRQEFEGHGVEYVHRRDTRRKTATSLVVDQVGQMLCAFGGDLQTAIRAKADIFESDTTYNEVFPVWISIGHIFAVQTLGWAYDRVKQELKTKSASGTMMEIEEKQLRLLDFPASKQFLICVIGDLREQVAGRQVLRPQAFELKDDNISGNGEAVIEAWVKVLKSILPIIVQNLPAEEYQVVRSTDYTETVSRQTKGIVAGAQVLQNDFADLRNLLKPV
jgi:hypothetical protein